MSYDPAKVHAFAQKESETHRLLGYKEELRAGDIYGGEDHGFVHTIGDPKCPTKPGTKAFELGMHFRPRRPKT